MVAIKKHFSYLPDGTVDIDKWLEQVKAIYQITDVDLIKRSLAFVNATTLGLTTFYGQPCIEQSLSIAEVLLELQLDQEAVAAGILSSAMTHTKLTDEIITKHSNVTVAKLVHSVLQMNAISNIHKDRTEIQIDRLRKTILAMASDIRVVLIKLAEKICILRGIKNINIAERKRIAQEILDIYAPLANRLGIGQLKWELEDISFHYSDTEKYKMIAQFLAERRVDRQARIQEVITNLKEQLSKAKINADITGRAKHIYSIYRKMQKKHLDYKNVYDSSAVRVLVPTIDDCYNTLSIVHRMWEHIPEEFDDYIAKPKPNGYRSIHTAVIGPHDKNLEIQIRTYDMHNEAEHGVAAHWVYKENNTNFSGYETKIKYLRQLLSWQKDVSLENNNPNTAETMDDRVYTFTPAGDIIDLANGATPLDFAYHIHTELGHRCRGAKINGHIVPLTHKLSTGDKVEIITIPNGMPSRDWLNKELGYLGTTRARAKVFQWFKQREITQYIDIGKTTLEREFSRAGLHNIDMQKIASRFNFKTPDALYATLGHGSIRAAQIVQAALQERHGEPSKIVTTKHTQLISEKKSDFDVHGVNDLLTRIAKCCKPIPGDVITGYITQGRGVSIHRLDCVNILNANNQNRLIDVNWDSKKLSTFYVDIQIQAADQHHLLKEITTVLSNAKIAIIHLHSTIYKKNGLLLINMTIEINNKEQLNKLISDITRLPHVTQVRRMHGASR